MNTRSILSFAVVAAFLSVGTQAAQADVVTNSGYETLTNTVGFLPDEYAIWEGDVSEIVTAQDDIIPFEGVQMLNFQATHSTGSSNTSGSEVWQILDISSFQGMIDSGNAVASADTYFNRVNGNGASEVDTAFSITLAAYSGNVADFPTLWQTGQDIAWAQNTIRTDGDVGTWEMASVSLNIPIDADFLMIRVAATENVFNDITGPEFAGHYADGTALTMVPAPAGLSLLAAGALSGLAVRRRRKTIA